VGEITKRFFEVSKEAIDVEHGIVFGWAITCTKDGKPYYDLNIDREGAFKGQRIPEHIDHDVMTKSATEFAESSERPGNEMHAGPDVGKFVFLMPVYPDTLKRMYGLDIPTPITGLQVGYKPTPEVLQKFINGEYTGFSIEGWHEDSELISDEA
jgi:hypothetical protein